MTFVIKEHRPGRWRAVILISVILWLVSIWAAYEYSWNQAIEKFDHEYEKNQTLQKRLSTGTAENREMRAKMAILERGAQVDRAAKVELAKNIKVLQGEAAKLREDVSFYKSIVSPEKGHSGIGVYSLIITAASQDLYHFKMVLTQAGKSASLARGSVDMTIKGILDGQEKHLKMSEVLMSKSKDLIYGFRYFQEMGGSLRFPQGFSPREVVVKLIHKKGSKIKNPVKRFDWIKVKV